MSKYSLGKKFKTIVEHLPELENAPIFNASVGTNESLVYKSDLISYLKHYDLPGYNDKVFDLTIGQFKSSNFNVVVQIYKSKEIDLSSCKGCVVFIHGYLDHFGLYKHLIKLLASSGYIVVGIDLPGHGLSTGKVAHIADFGEYVNSIEKLVDILSEKYKAYNFNYLLFGYSAGAAIGTEYLLRNSDVHPFTKILWFAPLLRIPRWKYSELAARFLPFLKYVPRDSKNSSHDSRFITFIRFNDPMQPRIVPLQWIRAMHHWAKRLAKYQSLNVDTCIIQGTEDKTIDWRYNIPNFSTIFTNHRVHYVYKGYHNLCNESEEYRTMTFNYIIKFIEHDINTDTAIKRNRLDHCSLA